MLSAPSPSIFTTTSCFWAAKLNVIHAIKLNKLAIFYSNTLASSLPSFAIIKLQFKCQVVVIKKADTWSAF